MKYIILLIFFSQAPFSQNNFDHSVFDELLGKAVNESGLIDYKYLKENKRFEEYLKTIGNAEGSGFSESEKLAFYINSYNAFVIKNILNHWPVNSPMNVDGFFKKYKFKVAGENLSLDEIEYKKVLPIEPVLSHFGLVCAAKSCPMLIPKAYTHQDVFSQLEENMRMYLQNATQNYLDKDNKTHLSQIFNWFKESFERKYGSLQKMALSFLKDSDVQFIISNEVKINFLNYNWELNSQ